MKRAWAVHPDPETGVISREEMIQGMLEAEVLLARAGGVISVVTDRAPTGIPGEMVTVFAVIEWKDRTDARPQPEQAVQVAQAPDPDPTPAALEATLAAEELLDEDNPDGLVVEADEDVSSITAGRR